MATIADTSRGIMRYVEEVTIGTTPANPLKELRFTGESLSHTKSTEVSNEIRSDRQITDLIPLDSEPSGDINYELSYDALDDFIPGALEGDWTSAVSIDYDDITATASDNSYNTAAGDFTSQGLSVGMWLKVAGFSTSGNNGYAKVESITALKIVVSGLTLTDEGPVGSPGVQMTNSGMCRNGTTAHAYTLEKEFDDITEYISYTGMEVNTMSLEMASNAIVTGALGFIGRDAASAQTTVGTGSPVYEAAPTNDVFNATSHIASIRDSSTELGASTYYATGLTITIENNLRGQKGIGVDGNVGVGKGRCSVTGTLSAYFVDNTLLDKFLNGTATSMDFRFEDAAGNAYIVTLPNVKYTAGNPEITGIDADVLLELDYQALRDATTDCTIQIDKFDA